MTHTLVYNTQEELPIDSELVKRVATLFCEQKGVKAHTLEITFVDLQTSSERHQDYFNDPTPTDCMTFPVDPPFEESEGSVLGEIVICPEVAEIAAQEHKTDYKKELIRYVIHGLLHMIGYDDKTNQQRQVMREEEDLFLSQLTHEF